MSVLQTDSLKFAFCEVWVVVADVEKAVPLPHRWNCERFCLVC